MLLWFGRLANRPAAEEYRLATPITDCPGCWRARARSVLGVRTACRVCGEKHGASGMLTAWRPRR